MCQGLGYNFTTKTHSLMGSDQEEIGLNLHSFRPLVQVGCSKDLKFFLCSAALPMCAPSYARPIGPCRHLCKRARRGCRPLLRQYGFDWPSVLRCSRFPDAGGNRLCLGDLDSGGGSFGRGSADRDGSGSGDRDGSGSADRDGSGSADRDGSGSADRDGSGSADRDGSGSADRDGSGSADRDGSGSADRDGSGSADRDGSGSADRDGSGSGDRDGSGSGDRDRSGSGDRDGSGSGDRDGSGSANDGDRSETCEC
ncbi:hypothetical protein BOX15_Mlig010918g1 [Macrostomum lignano]|uniref:FZ domain-containing protein n=1 Tax=Macrostomum lignano TaxID=282301 RepID=A0A267E319_9PLAT|nr:hypothetical protein BOX15_Mlig010918g1 [Macrostomum lignano]